MALIKCKDCGKEISDKSKACIFCGCPVPEPFHLDTMLRTTFDELAALTDELPLNGRLIFSTEDPTELTYYKLQPCKYNLIYKSKLLYESDYVIVIGLIDGHCTVAKDIYILAGGNVSDQDSRIEGIRDFIEEYYEQFCEKNKDGQIYWLPRD